MPLLMPRYLTAIVLIALLTAKASALVVETPVTPTSIKEAGSKFSVKVETAKDGLIHFTITYRPTEPQYLVAHFELREGQTLLAKTDAPTFAREKSATFYVAVPPSRLADAKFELSQNWFIDVGGQPVPEPGGTIFQIDLQAFGKNAPAAK